MERLVGLAVFLPLACSQILFPNEVRILLSSANSSASVLPGLQGSSPSRTIPPAVSVKQTEVIQQSQEAQLPSATRTPVTDLNLTVISSLEPIPPRIPGSFSAQPATITPTLKPTPVAFTSTVSSSPEVHTVADEESSLTSRTSTTTETQQVFSIPGRVDQSGARITPKPTSVSRTVPPSVAASDLPHASTNTKVPQGSFVTPQPVGLNTESLPNAGVRPFIQSSQTDEGFPSRVTNSLVTPPISVTTTTTTISTSTSAVSEESEAQDKHDSTDTFQNTTPAIIQDPSTPAGDIDDHMVISVMEDTDEPSSTGVDANPQPCTTPLGERGNCIHLTSCQGYNPLTNKTDSSIAVNFLRGRVCRILPRSLLFCCPDGEPILPVSF